MQMLMGDEGGGGGGLVFSTDPKCLCSKWAIGHSVQNTVWSILSISTPNPSPVYLSGSVDGVLDWGSNGC